MLVCADSAVAVTLMVGATVLHTTLTAATALANWLSSPVRNVPLAAASSPSATVWPKIAPLPDADTPQRGATLPVRLTVPVVLCAKAGCARATIDAISATRAVQAFMTPPFMMLARS